MNFLISQMKKDRNVGVYFEHYYIVVIKTIMGSIHVNSRIAL